MQIITGLRAGLIAGLLALTAGPVHAVYFDDVFTDDGEVDPRFYGPTMRVPYEPTLLWDHWVWESGDEGGGWWRLVEEGIFNTELYANVLIDHLAQMRMAYQVDCLCAAFRLNKSAMHKLESDLIAALAQAGYNPPHYTQSEWDALAQDKREQGMRIQDWLNLSSASDTWGYWYSGYSQSGHGSSLSQGHAWIGGPRALYGDPRLEQLITNKVNALMAGYSFSNTESLCSYAQANDRSGSVFGNLIVPWVELNDFGYR